MAGKSNWCGDWAVEIEEQLAGCLEAACSQPHGALQEFHQLLAQSTGHELSESEYRDACLESLVWAIWHANPSVARLQATFARKNIYSGFVAELLRAVQDGPNLNLPLGFVSHNAVGPSNEAFAQFESYLAARDPRQRLRRGAFYTPQVIARHIVAQIDAVLRHRFRLSDGLADTTTWEEMQTRFPTLNLPQGVRENEAFVQILDPATGTGVFLLEVVESIHRTMRTKWRVEGVGEQEILARWNDYVPRHLLPRVHAVELMPTPSVIAQILLAEKLAETGYDFRSEQTFRLSIGDALLPPHIVASLRGETDTVQSSVSVLRETLSRVAFTVVLGNPPFRGISSNPAEWIGALLRGTGPGGEHVASYYEVDGQPLGERKLWLQDDYVKFMRFAQWQIERSGAGIVGFVTNHGYLDNATFRGMRQAMLDTFPRIDVLDLHGNRKKNKLTPDGRVDEGVFDIEQGVAVGIFSRTSSREETHVTHRQVWGSRAAKIAAIEEDEQVSATKITPSSPHYLLVPDGSENHPEYAAGFALNDAMPVNSTAVVTARDSFVIAFDEASLASRMDAFCDESISDAEIRSCYFTNSRSTKYPPGDTRGWKLNKARQRMMQMEDRTKYFRPCLYRPFDMRTIFWADWMIDWPRRDVMQHMLRLRNIALVARRQMPPTGPCSFFWVTDTIALDGLIRSDNRGSESVFPLWLATPQGTMDVNLSPPFIETIERRLDLRCQVSSDRATGDSFTPIDVLHYIYALFNTPTYRQRYGEDLRRDFPRILLPKCQKLWKKFCDIGDQLTQLHSMRASVAGQPTGGSIPPVQIRAGFPKYASGRIWLNKEGLAIQATDRVWNFHVGAHQVCRKWLRDRKVIDATALQTYRTIVAGITKTLELADQLEAAVANAGGWEAVFAT